MGFGNGKGTLVWQILEEMYSLGCALRKEIKQWHIHHNPTGKPLARSWPGGVVSCWLDSAGWGFLTCIVETRHRWGLWYGLQELMLIKYTAYKCWFQQSNLLHLKALHIFKVLTCTVLEPSLIFSEIRIKWKHSFSLQSKKTWEHS